MGVKWAVKMQRKALQIGTKWAKSEVRQQRIGSEEPRASLPLCRLTQQRKERSCLSPKDLPFFLPASTAFNNLLELALELVVHFI